MPRAKSGDRLGRRGRRDCGGQSRPCRASIAVQALVAQALPDHKLTYLRQSSKRQLNVRQHSMYANLCCTHDRLFFQIDDTIL